MSRIPTGWTLTLGTVHPEFDGFTRQEPVTARVGLQVLEAGRKGNPRAAPHCLGSCQPMCENVLTCVWFSFTPGQTDLRVIMIQESDGEG